MNKSPEAFRTIREASQELGVPQHVLRFWETKFSQVRPLKRGGGRRYYRPEDVELLRRIQSLLYSETAGGEVSEPSRPASKIKVSSSENQANSDRASKIITELETLRDMLRGRIPT